MRRLTRRSLSAASLALFVVAVAACGSGSNTSSSSGASGGTEKVTVGVIPILDVAPVYLGKEKGVFARHGIDLTLESGQGGAAIVPAVISGQFQFGFSNVTSLLVAADKKLPLKIVAAGNSSTGQGGNDFSEVVVRGDSPIQSAKDLAGKTVAVNTLKNIGDTTVRESIRKAGGDPKGVKFVELAFPDMPAAVANGRVDAAWVVEPFVSVAKSQGDRVVASNLVDTAPNLMISAYFTSKQLQQSNPNLLKKFTDAINESMQYADSHPDEARNVITTYTKVDPALLPKLTLPKWPTQINRDSTQKLADLAQQDGLISNKADLSALLP